MDPVKAVAANIDPVNLGSTATVSVVLVLVIKWLTDRHTRQLDELLARMSALETKLQDLSKRLES